MVAMTHKHHIIPKYRGGTNAKENLVEVSVTQHAMFHYCNWRLWNEKEDWLAWKGLTGEVGKEEIVKAMRLKGAKSGLATMHERLKILRSEDSAFVEREKKRLRKLQPTGVEAALSPESRQKRLASFKRIKHQSGESNSQHGTMWITNGETNRKIRKTEPIPEGYYKGRKLK